MCVSFDTCGVGASFCPPQLNTRDFGIFFYDFSPCKYYYTKKIDLVVDDI